MNRINRNNYERYFIDFIDGTLSDDFHSELHAFLLKNPDLAQELEEITGFKLQDDRLHHPEIASNKKSIAPGESPAFPPAAFTPSKLVKPLAIRRLRGESIVFDAKSTLYRQENQLSWNLLPGFSCRLWKKPAASIFQSAQAVEVLPRLIAPTIVFEHKESLKKNAGGARVITLRRALRYSSAAAAIAVLVWWSNTPNSVSADLAHQDQTQSIQPLESEKKAPSNGPTPEKNNAIPSSTKQEQFIPGEIAQPHVAVQEEVVPAASPAVIIPSISQEPEEEVANVELTPSSQSPENNEVAVNPDTSEEKKKGKANTQNVKTYSSIWDYAEDKAKSSLWGNKDYPEDNFTYALLEKEVNKGLKKEEKPAISYKKDEENQTKVFRIKLGKFEYIRSR